MGEQARRAQDPATDPAWPDSFIVNRKKYEALVNLTSYARHEDSCSTVRVPGHQICDCGFVYWQAQEKNNG